MLLCPDCQTAVLEDRDSCQNCGWQLSYLDGIPAFLSSKELADRAKDRYSQQYDDLARKNLEQSIIERPYLDRQAANVVRYLPSARGLHVCDIGVGQGFLARRLVAAGARQVTAVDVSLAYLADLKGIQGIQPVLANAENLPFKAAFDLIVSTDVMEHVLNLGSFMFSMNRSLRPNGLAAIRVPYRENLLKYSPHLHYPYEFGHLRNFDRRLLRMILRQAGFTPIAMKIDGFGIGMPQPYAIDTKWKRDRYIRLQKFLMRKLPDPTVVTQWPSFLARILMRPNEICVIARKTHEIEVTGKARLVLHRIGKHGQPRPARAFWPFSTSGNPSKA